MCLILITPKICHYYPRCNLSVCAPLYSGIVTHFQFLYHFGKPHCRRMCNCIFEKVSRRVYVCCIVV